MTVKKENKFFVVNLKYLEGLPEPHKEKFEEVLKQLQGQFYSVNVNKYIVCNQDEPYSEKVWKIILEGEKKKLKNGNSR